MRKTHDEQTASRAGQGDNLATLGREVGRAVEELAALTRSWWPPKTVRRRLIRDRGPAAGPAAQQSGDRG